MMITKVDKYVAGTYRQQFNMGLDFGSLGGGILGSIGNLFGLNQQKKENARNRQFAHDEAVLAHERNLEIMDKTNEWNSPENQRKLLAEAGYNPHALFQNGGAVGRGSGSSGAAQASNPSQGSVGQGLLDPSMITALSQAALASAQAKKTEKESEKISQETSGVSMQNEMLKFNLKLQEEFGRYQHILGLEKLEFERDCARAQKWYIETQDKLANYDLTNTKPQEFANLVQSNLESQMRTYESEMKAAKTKEEKEYISKNFALQVRYYTSLAVANYARANLDNANAESVRNMTDLWKPGGILHSNAIGLGRLNDANRLNLLQTYNQREKIYNETVDDVIKGIKSRLNLQIKQDKHIVDMFFNDNKPITSWLNRSAFQILHTFTGYDAITPLSGNNNSIYYPF